MKLLLDEEGKAVLKDGLPVYKYDDGSEQPFDAKATLDSLNGKIKNLTDEKDRHYNDAKEAKEKLKDFKDIDLETVTKNAQIVKKLNDKELVDEKGVEALKETMKAGFEEEKQGIHKKHKKVLEGVLGEKSELEKIIYELAVVNKFSSDPHFSGKEPLTIYPAEDAAKIFGDSFKVEIKDGKPMVVAKDRENNTVMSKKNHGEIADFHEAIGILIDKHPRKNEILRGGENGGPGAGGNLGANDKDFKNLKPTEKIKVGLEKLKK